DVAEILVAAAECRGEQAERRGGGLGDEVAKRAPDHAAEAELRIVQRAGYRHVHVDVAFAVLQQGYRQLHRQVRHAGAVHALAEGQLGDEDVVVGVELALVQQVVHVSRQLALGDRVASVFAGVGAEPGQLNVGGLALDVEGGHRLQRVDVAADVHWRGIVQLRLRHQFGGRFAGGGAERADPAGKAGEVGGVVGLDEVVGVV